MTLFKINAASTILIEDDCDINTMPLILYLVQSVKDTTLCILNYEKQISLWERVFEGTPKQCTKLNDGYKPFTSKTICFIDSINQMVLSLGWTKCLNYIKQMQNDQNVIKIIIVLHKDCLLPMSKLQVNLNHLANSIITYDEKNCRKVYVQNKKGGKYTKSVELLTYNNQTKSISLNPEPNVEKKSEEVSIILPNTLTTFKIETDQIQQLEKYKLKLPYMSKINEGQGKVYYEPDAVDDWDEEDPDDDLEI